MTASPERAPVPLTTRRRGARVIAGVCATVVTALALAACEASADSAASTSETMASDSATTSTASGRGTTGSGATPPDTTSPGNGSPASTSSGSPSTKSNGGTDLGPLLPVLSVIDGDTIAVRLDGARVKVRLIGVDTPETRKPNTPVQCFGPQATSRLQSLVQSRSVRLQADPSQGDLDKYGRSLRYVFTTDGQNVAQTLIAGGFGREYTYAGSYRLQSSFRATQTTAQQSRSGLWGACTSFGAPVNTPRTTPTDPGTNATPRAGSKPPAPQEPAAACAVKGNISSTGEKIYHVPGGTSYAKTKITASKGERMFCSEAQAQAAGWRAARD